MAKTFLPGEKDVLRAADSNVCLLLSSVYKDVPFDFLQIPVKSKVWEQYAHSSWDGKVLKRVFGRWLIRGLDVNIISVRLSICEIRKEMSN